MRNVPHLYESDVVSQRSGQPRRLLLRRVREPLRKRPQALIRPTAYFTRHLENGVSHNRLHSARDEGRARSTGRRRWDQNVGLVFYVGIEHVGASMPDLEEAQVLDHVVRVGLNLPPVEKRILFVKLGITPISEERLGRRRRKEMSAITTGAKTVREHIPGRMNRSSVRSRGQDHRSS